MLDYDEIVVFVVDEKGNPLEKHGPVQWSGELREGQDIPLKLEGRDRLFRVLGQRPGEGQGRLVQVIEVDLKCPFCGGRLREDGLAGLEQDTTGAFITCRHCSRRVAMERTPTPPGGPVCFRVASE